MLCFFYFFYITKHARLLQDGKMNTQKQGPSKHSLEKQGNSITALIVIRQTRSVPRHFLARQPATSPAAPAWCVQVNLAGFINHDAVVIKTAEYWKMEPVSSTWRRVRDAETTSTSSKMFRRLGFSFIYFFPGFDARLDWCLKCKSSCFFFFLFFYRRSSSRSLMKSIYIYMSDRRWGRGWSVVSNFTSGLAVLRPQQ